MADRNLNIRVAFSALNNMSRPVNAARQSAAALASQINQTKTSIKGLERQATSFDRLTAANKKTTEQLAQAKEQARQMAAAYGPLRQRSAEQVAALNQQRAAIRQLTQQQKGEQTQLNQLRASFYSEGIAISSASLATEQINQRTAQYNRQLAEQQRRLDAVNQAQARYSRAKETGEKMMSGGMKTAAVGAATLAPVAAAVKSYSSLEDAMKGVAKQVNGLRDDSGNRTPQYEEMQRAIMDASEKLPMANGAVDYAALVEGGARMGVANSDDPWKKQKADLLAFASMAAKASVAFELPADQLSESLGKIAGLYKIPTQNIEQLGDAINYLDDNAKSKGSDIIDVLQRVGGLASQLDYKQAAALGSTFLTLGTPAEVAASATNAMVRELSIATVQGKNFMQGLDALGLSAEKVQKSMSVDAMGTIISVLEASKKLAPDQQVANLTQIFGKEFGDDAQKLANNLPELRRQIELTQGAAAKGSMNRESDINKASLSAQWQLTKTGAVNAFSSAGETLRDPLMDIMLTVSKVVGSVRRWVEANPALVGSIMKVTAAIGALLVVVGGLMLSIGAVLGPMALVRLSFTTLAGEGGIARLTGGVMRLGGAFQWLAGSPMQALLSAGRMVFGPLITLLAGISAPVWGLIALFAAAAVAVIKFWQPIKAFFSGFFTGLMAGLQPITQAFNAVFAPLAPIFDSIGNAISGVWEWFTKLLEPIQFSSEALASCTSAGETFGKMVGGAISALTLPIQAVAKGLGWILEKLGAIPDAAKAAQQVAQQMTPEAVNNLADRVNAFSGDVQAVAKESKKAEEKKKTDEQKKQDNLINSLKGPANIVPKMNSSLDKIATHTTEKKDGPGEIVFKNKQPYIPIRGGYSEPLKQAQRQLPSLTDWVTQQAGSLISSVTPWQVEKPAAREPVSASPSAASVAALMPAPGGDVYNLNFDFSGQKLDEETIIRRVREELALAKQQADRRKRSQLTDHV
ncbi:phage tail tape measure protein [Salmonella enterica]|uniref:Phage tail tape measure protein n=1 Tax=Salmonella enterica subsp. enterica serovar Braenderup TaxID=149391 RepID=A0A5H8GYY6_SALET|nr:phage tail tape measure protein [Salmonella enterica]EAA0750054.1 phage tail tape measure protein [Salmonella enterica subsp. enterica serovar Braenderup]EAC2142806.1 phage tail tape measure protein [Salmonella enterica subsp. enterica]EDC8048622.1 phage tail tape measure protein [Salmonella enterica subsp. enterica serovar Muenchen]EDD3260586.1 phage tail tape measure protein [Salmonella enterica subsp. enterica serovar Newport]EAA3694406.1 phage tail tape measure protein [Salmonella enter